MPAAAERTRVRWGEPGDAPTPPALPEPGKRSEMSKRRCSVDGCDRPSRDVGLCIMHATRWRRTGSTDDPRDVTRRFWAKVDRSGGCWLWTASLTHNGYARFPATHAKSVRAHRWIYEAEVGPIPDGYEVDHLCHVRHCVRPSHLRAVPKAENVRSRRPFVFANSRKTHCPQGHPYDDENTYWRSSTQRECRVCRNQRGRRARSR